jgi:peptidoglycan/LPS O-acetylase OafA/YrhL
MEGVVKRIQLSNFTSGRNNNLDALRLGAALMVVFNHALNNPPSLILRDTIGQVGVLAFFFISGFLITQSYLRDENPKRFMVSRFLRIYPALVAVVLLTAFVLGPLMSSLSIGNYFKSGETYLYLTTISLLNWKTYLPGISYQMPMNAALWTLQYEFVFYIIILILGITKLLKMKYLLIGLTITGLVLTQVFTTAINATEVNMPNAFNIYQAIRLFSYFGFGAVAYLYRDVIPFKTWLVWVTVAVMFVGMMFGGLPTSLFVIPLAYLILFLGYSSKVNFKWATKFGDFSYGIYIWHFPVILLILYCFHFPLDSTGMLLFAMIMSYLIAVVSWYLIEKRALKLKERFARG